MLKFCSNEILAFPLGIKKESAHQNKISLQKIKKIHVQLEMHTLMLFYHVTTSSSFDAKDSLFKSIYTMLTKGYADPLLKCLKT